MSLSKHQSEEQIVPVPDTLEHEDHQKRGLRERKEDIQVGMAVRRSIKFGRLKENMGKSEGIVAIDKERKGNTNADIHHGQSHSGIIEVHGIQE